mgnify:CR=1 FL=1
MHVVLFSSCKREWGGVQMQIMLWANLILLIREKGRVSVGRILELYLRGFIQFKPFWYIVYLSKKKCVMHMIYAEWLFGYFFVIISYLLGPAGVSVPKRQFSFIFFYFRTTVFRFNCAYDISVSHTFTDHDICFHILATCI